MSGTIEAHRPRVWTAWPVVVIGLLGLVIGAYSAASQLRLHEWDPAGMVAVGVADTAIVEYSERQFDRDIPLRSTVGHDGRFFLIQCDGSAVPESRRPRPIP